MRPESPWRKLNFVSSIYEQHAVPQQAFIPYTLVVFSNCTTGVPPVIQTRIKAPNHRRDAGGTMAQ